MSSQKKNNCFVLNLPMKTEIWHKHILEKRFRFHEIFYNDLLQHQLKKYNRMTHLPEWIEADKSIKKLYQEAHKNAINKDHTLTGPEKKALKEASKPYQETKNILLKEYGMSDFSFKSEALHYRKRGYGHLIGSTEAQAVGTNMWKAFEKNLFQNGKQVHFKRRGSITTIANTMNTCGLRVIQESDRKWFVKWDKMQIPLEIDWKDPFKVESLQHKIKFCRVKRIPCKSGYRYYCQIMLDGIPPAKIDKKTGEFKCLPGEGQVIVDVQSDRVVLTKDGHTVTYPLAPNLEIQDHKIQKIDRKMERSRRLSNPEYFNEDGTIKRRVKKERRYWKNSNNYKKLQTKKKYLSHHVKRIRQIEHEKLANLIIPYGDEFVIKASYKDQEKLKKDNAPTKNDKAERKYQTSKAPANFVDVLTRKLSYFDITPEKYKNV